MAETELEETAVPEETEFDSAFDEIAAAKEPGNQSPDDDEAPQDKTDPVAKASEPEEDKPAPEAAEEEGEKAVTDASMQSPEAGSDSEPDPYEGLSPAVKEEMIALKESNKELTHRLKSDAGRVSAFQRQVNTLQNEIQTIRAGSTAGDQPTTSQIADAMKGTNDEWDQFKEDYPQVANAIDSRLEMAGKATAETIEQTLAPVVQRQDQVELNQSELSNQSRVEAVAEVYPTWTEAVKTEKFSLWLDNQSPGIMALADSDDTNDASTLIGLYDDYLVANGDPTLKADPTEPGVNNEEQKTDGADEPSDLAKRRQQQLTDGTTVPSKPAGIDPGGEAMDEFDQAFNYHAKRLEARRQA